MDFFQQQESARRRSRFLVLWFILAIIGVIAAVYAVALVLQGVVATKTGAGSVRPDGVWDPETLMTVSGITLLIICCSSGYKMLRLLRGGEAIALDLGGRRIASDTTDTDERRLLNVVEEMSIASGCPVPDVFLLENEDSINAFAAGRDTSDAVIGVTRGCIRHLNREELQGVVAHEFSHILNGDMKLNLRMVGLLFGILSIAILGQVLMRVGFRAGRHVRVGRDGREGASIATVMLVVGVSLYVVGYIGVFLAHLIKASMSRQREFLADASAVQFTRNPDGIGGALKKIGGHSQGSQVLHPLAEEASHMFFGNALGSGFSGKMFASHPPLAKRLQKIFPHWDGSFETPGETEVSRGWREGKKDRKRKGGRGRARKKTEEDDGDGTALGEILGGGMMAAGLEGIEAGPQPEHLELAQKIHAEFPREWLRHSHHSAGAQTIVFALLLGEDQSVETVELEALAMEVDRVAYEETLDLARQFNGIPSTAKLALVDISLPALRRMSPAEYERFLRITELLIAADGEVNLFEFTLRKIFSRHLDKHFHRAAPAKVKYDSPEELAHETSVLLSTMVGLAKEEVKERQIAFADSAHAIEKEWEGIELKYLGSMKRGYDEVDAALDKWDLAAPLLKKRLLLACGTAIVHDGKIGNRETEFLRAIADTIHEPLPPLVV